MGSLIIFAILRFLLVPIVIIGLIIFFLRHRRRRSHPFQDKEWYLRVALSREDAISQMYLALSFLFFGLTLFAFNRDFGDQFSWRIIFLLISAIGIAIGYYLRTISVLSLSLVGLIAWWGAQSAYWNEKYDTSTSIIIVGLLIISLLYYILGCIHEKEIRFKRIALLYRLFGIIIASAIVFLISTNMGLRVFNDFSAKLSIFASWQLILSLAVMLISIFVVSFYSIQKKLLSVYEALSIIFLAGLYSVFVFLPQQELFVYSRQYYSNNLSEAGILWAIIFNIVAFLELLGLIFSGYLRRETWLINLGALFIFLFIITKYFDWFFSFFDKSLFFIGAGILLFIVGYFMEKGRKRMIKQIKEKNN